MIRAQVAGGGREGQRDSPVLERDLLQLVAAVWRRLRGHFIRQSAAPPTVVAAADLGPLVTYRAIKLHQSAGEPNWLSYDMGRRIKRDKQVACITCKHRVGFTN